MYTPLKRISTFNTFFGAIVGAIPPFIGSFAVEGTLLTVEPLLLSVYIFAWQFPHFYGILYQNREDYKKAGYEMISKYDESGQRAANQAYLAATLGSLMPCLMVAQGMLHPAVLPVFAYY